MIAVGRVGHEMVLPFLAFEMGHHDCAGLDEGRCRLGRLMATVFGMLTTNIRLIVIPTAYI